MDKEYLEEYKFNVELGSMLNTNELNRIQRCAKNKDKKEILKWAEDFENRLSEYYHRRYKNYYLEQFKEMMTDNDVALIYALHFGESTKFGNKRLKSIMDDIKITRKGFYKDNFKREDYIEMLRKDKINI